MTSPFALPAGVTVTDRRGVTSEGRVAIATAPATRRTMDPMRMASEYPSVMAVARRARPGARCARALEVRLAASVARTASPIEAPTVRDVLSRPDASPASPRGTPVVPATVTGVTNSPMPRPISRNGPSRSRR